MLEKYWNFGQKLKFSRNCDFVPKLKFWLKNLNFDQKVEKSRPFWGVT